MDIFKSGKNFELEALGSINRKKELDLSRDVIREQLIQKLFPGYSNEAVERFFDKHPEERESFEKKIEDQMTYKFVKNPEKYVYDIETALKIVKECQPNYLPGLTDDLYNKVAEKLKIEDRDENDNFYNLKIYTAVDSKVDYSFGIDAFIVYTYYDESELKEKEIIVSLDITINNLKNSSKADVILTFQEDATDSRSRWSEPVFFYAVVIAEKIKEKIKQNNKHEYDGKN